MRDRRLERVGDRRPTILDAVVVIAATAIALAMARGWDSGKWCAIPAYATYGGKLPSGARSLHHFIATWLCWTIPFAITLSVAVLALRFRSPRPRFRRLERQPGAVACAAALFAMAARMSQESLAFSLAYLTRPSSAIQLPSPPFNVYENIGWHKSLGEIFRIVVLEEFPLQVSSAVGIAVIVAWGVQRASGTWRPEVSWLDRSGRLLGVYWIALAVAVALLAELWKFIL
jgi:hypothetical protein